MMFSLSPIALVSFFHVLNDGFRVAIIALIPYLAHTLDLSYTQAGLLGSCVVGVQALTTLPASLIARRRGDLLVLRAGLICYSLSILALRTSLWYPLLIFIYCLAGIGFSAFHPVGSAFVAKNSPRFRLGKNLGLMTSAGDIGKIVVPALTTLILTKLGWQTTTSFLGGLGIAVFMASFLNRRSKEKLSFFDKKAETLKKFIRRVNLALIRRNLTFIYALILGGLDCFTQEPINIFLPFWALTLAGNQRAVGFTLSFYFAGSLIGKNLLGLLSDKKSSFAALLTAEVGLILTSLIISFLTNINFLYLWSFVLGTFSKGTSPVIKKMLGQSIRSQSYNLVFGLSETTDAIADALSPLFFGFIADSISLQSVFWINIFFVMIMIYCGLLYQRKRRVLIVSIR